MIATPSQTIGPFFHPAMTWLPVPVGGTSLGGCVLDGDGAPVDDALLELWQPGRFSRAVTGPDGRYAASVDGAGPVLVSLFARGLLQRLVTVVLLPGDDEAVAEAVDEERRATLRAAVDGDGLRFDVHLQGPRETVFFVW